MLGGLRRCIRRFLSRQLNDIEVQVMLSLIPPVRGRGRLKEQKILEVN